MKQRVTAGVAVFGLVVVIVASTSCGGQGSAEVSPHAGVKPAVEPSTTYFSKEDKTRIRLMLTPERGGADKKSKTVYCLTFVNLSDGDKVGPRDESVYMLTVTTLGLESRYQSAKRPRTSRWSLTTARRVTSKTLDVSCCGPRNTGSVTTW